jgi:hypothetical protein
MGNEQLFLPDMLNHGFDMNPANSTNEKEKGKSLLRVGKQFIYL